MNGDVKRDLLQSIPKPLLLVVHGPTRVSLHRRSRLIIEVGGEVESRKISDGVDNRRRVEETRRTVLVVGREG